MVVKVEEEKIKAAYWLSNLAGEDGHKPPELALSDY